MLTISNQISIFLFTASRLLGRNVSNFKSEFVGECFVSKSKEAPDLQSRRRAATSSRVPRLCHCLTHLHLGSTASVLCPGTLPEKVALDEFSTPPGWPLPPWSHFSPRSPASSPVTHSAPGDRYYILYHSLCTSSRGARPLTCTHVHARTHARQCGGKGGGRRSGSTQKQAQARP